MDNRTEDVDSGGGDGWVGEAEVVVADIVHHDLWEGSSHSGGAERHTAGSQRSRRQGA